MRLILVGFGTVGQGLAEILRDKAPELREQYGFSARIVGVATGRRGSLYDPNGLNIDHLLTAALSHLDDYPDSPALQRNLPTDQLIREAQADVMVEASPSNLQTAQPALDYCMAALTSGKHVVMANKGPVSIAYRELAQTAQQNGKKLGFEATVMAGTPAMRLALEGLAGCRILQAKGILNGTTNYILEQMASGMDYDEALAQAQSLGYAETDPTADVDGWDAAGKAVILANVLFGGTHAEEQGTIAVRGIRDITPEQIQAAQAAGERWKLVVRVSPHSSVVRPVRVPLSDPLAHVGGAVNAVTYTTDLLGDVTLVGPGAGRLQTGFGLLADLLAIHRAVS